jgi:hypothetical protein
MFSKYQLEFDNNLFDELSETTKFENITNGRNGAILVNNNNIIPIVRTTTKYNNPAQLFMPIHYNIINKIQTATNIDINFNNALIEIYNNDYKSMGEHSDQALDLANNLSNDSYICLFTCYNNPLATNIRTLKTKNKLTNELLNFELNHNSIVLFSLQTNSNHLHKIILDNNNINNDEWLGITFRLSKTFIKFINEIPYFTSSLGYNTNIILKKASKEESKEFYKCRSMENKSINYIWPIINYTISPSDTISLV